MPRSARGGRPAPGGAPGKSPENRTGPGPAIPYRIKLPKSARPAAPEPAVALPAGKLAAARIGAPRGVRGDLKVQSYSGEVEHLLDLREAELYRDGRSLRLRVLRAEVGPGGLSMAFEGYASPETAQNLTGMELLVDRADAAPLRKNEWYVVDLVGLELVPPGGGTPYGRVRAVVEGGADPCLETELPDGSRVLVPFRKEFVGTIDLEARTAELVAPWILE